MSHLRCPNVTDAKPLCGYDCTTCRGSNYIRCCDECDAPRTLVDPETGASYCDAHRPDKP